MIMLQQAFILWLDGVIFSCRLRDEPLITLLFAGVAKLVDATDLEQIECSEGETHGVEPLKVGEPF